MIDGIGPILAIIIIVVMFISVIPTIRATDTVGGQVWDRSRAATAGARQWLGNQRNAAMQRNLQSMARGDRYRQLIGNNLVSRALDRTAMGIAQGPQGAFGIPLFGRGRAAVDRTRSTAAAQLRENERYKTTIQGNDAAMRAATYGSAEEARRAMRTIVNDRGERQFTDTEIDEGIGAVQTLGGGVGFGSAHLQMAAVQDLLESTGTGFENADDMIRTMARVSRGNTSVAGRLAGLAGGAAAKGRHDLALRHGATRDLVVDYMSGREPRQAAVDQAVLQAIASVDTATLARTTRRETLVSLGDISSRVSEARLDPALRENYIGEPPGNYAGNAAQYQDETMDDMIRDMSSTIVELDQVHGQFGRRDAAMEAQVVADNLSAAVGVGATQADVNAAVYVGAARLPEAPPTTGRPAPAARRNLT